MRSVWICLLFLPFICSVTYAADDPIAGIDPLLYAQEGWQWGALIEPETTIDATNQGIVLNIQPAAAGQYVGKVSGGLGVSYMTDRFGAMQFDADLYEIEVKFRVLSENLADSFRIVTNEPDLDPDPAVSTSDEFQYYFSGLLDYEENEWVTVTTPLSTPGYVWSPGGDQIQDDGLASVQIGPQWDTSAALNIELASILLKPINPTPDNIAFEFNANNAKRAWWWDAFNEDGAVVNNGDTILINLDEDGDDGDTNGGLGMHWLTHNFDAETSELVVTAKLGPDNLASNFTVSLKDDDGLDGIQNWENPKELDQSAEEWQFTFSTAELTEDEFTELRLPFLNEDGLPTSSWRQKPGEPLSDGDGEMNFGNYMIQFMRTWNNTLPLNIELKSIRIETEFSNPCDLNGDGDCNAVDIDALTVATLAGSQDPKYDLDGNGSLNFDDRKVMVDDLLYTYFGDANLDGQFSSADFVEVFSAGQYEDAVADNSGWATGDWDGDLDFSSADFVAAFAAGGYEMGPRAAVSAVPEPSSMVLFGLALLGLAARRRTGR